MGSFLSSSESKGPKYVGQFFYPSPLGFFYPFLDSIKDSLVGRLRLFVPLRVGRVGEIISDAEF